MIDGHIKEIKKAQKVLRYREIQARVRKPNIYIIEKVSNNVEQSI